MSLPPLASVPPLKLRLELAPAEWEACLDAWITLAELYLRLPEADFSAASSSPGTLDSFLTSFYHEVALAGSNDSQMSHESIQVLKNKSFLLFHRTVSSTQAPQTYLQWGFLTDFAHAYPHSESVRILLKDLHEKHVIGVEASLQKIKSVLIKELESQRPEAAEPDLRRIVHLLRASPEAGSFFMTGSDFVDSLTSSYGSSVQNLRPRLVTLLYLGLTSLLQSSKPNFSLLSDHLYSLKTQAEAAQKASKTSETLLADLITNTPFLNVMQKETSPEASRARNSAASLASFENPALRRPRRAPPRKVNKGKARATHDHDSSGKMHMHKMSLITQIQDLFPDLGAGFVMKLLDAYNDNVEEVTAHLLEDSLLPHLASADRTEQMSVSFTSTHVSNSADPARPSLPSQPHLTPRSTPPPPADNPLPIRRNIYDNDDFDRLAISTSQLHIGSKDRGTADALLSTAPAPSQKAAILSALSAFDADEDEHDDTYDAEDVGGTVDTPATTEDTDPAEEALFKAYTSTPAVFARDAATRRSKERQVLRTTTGMTDEALEGWALMLARDPRRVRRLEERYTAHTGVQRELAPSAWRADAEGEGEERHAGDRMRGGRGGFRGGRGRGRGGRGAPGGGGGGDGSSRGGAAAGGPAGQQSRAKKEANKSSRANHSRREQRAKKMARGGFAG